MERLIANDHWLVPLTSSAATALVKYAAKTKVTMTVGNAELAQS